MLITATEFREKIGQYLTLADQEDIIITKNGKPFAKLTSLKKGAASITDSLIGVLPDTTVDLERLREERLLSDESIDRH
jgi:prevent-host-death family protein